MTDFTLTDRDKEREINLGNSKTLTITNLAGGSVEIYIDRESNGSYTSAIKGSAGYLNPITLHHRGKKEVQISDLESRRVRVAIKGDGAKVEFKY